MLHLVEKCYRLVLQTDMQFWSALIHKDEKDMIPEYFKNPILHGGGGKEEPIVPCHIQIPQKTSC